MNLQLNEIPIMENDLKKILIEIKSGNKTWEEVDKIVIVKSMMDYIGSVDSELRDELIYSLFYELILEKNQLGHDLLVELLDYCLNELLFKGIGEIESDTVFTRSFSSLLIALILYRDNLDDFLSESKVNEIKEKIIDYTSSEKDFRGYVAEKGWAHSVAHAADMIDELVKNPKLNKESYTVILKHLWQLIIQSDSVYIHNEDERLLVPILEMLNNGLETNEIELLLQNLSRELTLQKELLDEEHYRFLVFNCKTFLKSFYITTNKHTKLTTLNRSIEKALLHMS